MNHSEIKSVSNSSNIKEHWTSPFYRNVPKTKKKTLKNDYKGLTNLADFQLSPL